MSLCACDFGDGAFCSGGLSLPCSRGVWSMLLSTGLLGYPTRCPEAVGDSHQLSGLPVPNELLLSGTSQVSRLCQPAGWSSSPKLWQAAAACAPLGSHLLSVPSKSGPLPVLHLRGSGGGRQSSARGAEHEHTCALLLPPARAGSTFRN